MTIGLTVVFAAIALEYFGYRLSGVAVGFVFVVVWSLSPLAAATRDGTSS